MQQQDKSTNGRGDKVARVIMAGLGYVATELLSFPGSPPWLVIVAKVVVVMLAAGSPSLVGIQKEHPLSTFKSATKGGIDQVSDSEEPK